MNDIYGVILAGGQGKRLHYQDKGLVQIAGLPLVKHVIKALSPQVDHIVISANQNIKQYREYGFEVLEDTLTGFAGPLAGLLTAMTHLHKDREPVLCLMVPCDAPLLPEDLLERLLKAYSERKTLAVIPHDGIRLQPLFGLFSTGALSSLDDYLVGGNRKVTTWVESLHPCIVDFSDVSVS